MPTKKTAKRKKPVKRRKPDALRKEASIRIRMTDEQKRQFEKAAERAGLDVSSWLRMLGVRELSRG